MKKMICIAVFLALPLVSFAQVGSCNDAQTVLNQLESVSQEINPTEAPLPLPKASVDKMSDWVTIRAARMVPKTAKSILYCHEKYGENMASSFDEECRCTDDYRDGNEMWQQFSDNPTLRTRVISSRDASGPGAWAFFYHAYAEFVNEKNMFCTFVFGGLEGEAEPNVEIIVPISCVKYPIADYH